MRADGDGLGSRGRAAAAATMFSCHSSSFEGGEMVQLSSTTARCEEVQPGAVLEDQ